MMFLSVRTHGSVTAAARALSSTPSHVSKSISRLERQLRTRLLARSGRGVTLTSDAVRLMPLLVTAADSLRRARLSTDAPRDVTVAAPSYLLNVLVPSLAALVPSMRFRGLQMAPPNIAAAMGSRQFEVALSTGEPKLPPAWRAHALGVLSTGLFAMPALAKKLGRVTTLDALKQVPFVTPVSFNNNQWSPIDDGCPLPVGERIAGHEAPAIGLALEIAARVPHLVFGPRIAARAFLKQKRLVELHVPGWTVESQLYLAVDVDRITTRELKLMTDVAMELVG